MKNNLVLIAKGTKYVSNLITDAHLIGDHLDVTIFTDEVDRVSKFFKQASIRRYEHHVFRYFDKFKLTYKVLLEKQQPVMYLDAKRIKSICGDATDLTYFDSSKINHFYTQGNWAKPNALTLRNWKSEYLADNYFDNILDAIEGEGIKLRDISVILERVFVMPVNKNTPKVIEALESVRWLFEQNSKNKENVYAGIGNGEGLALGYALRKNGVNHRTLNLLPIIKQKTL